jgi:hypothetical protein
LGVVGVGLGVVGVGLGVVGFGLGVVGVGLGVAVWVPGEDDLDGDGDLDGLLVAYLPSQFP